MLLDVARQEREIIRKGMKHKLLGFLPCSTSFIMSLQSGRLLGRLRSCSSLFSLEGSTGAFLKSGGGGIFGGSGGGIGGGVGFSKPVAKMSRLSFVVLVGILCSCSTHPTTRLQKTTYDFPFVTREEWGARPPTVTAKMDTPVPFVVIHHTYIPDVCHTLQACKSAMRGMQNFHQLTNGWGDIGYNFAVGGEGSVFEGRGWEAVGAHAIGMNTRSIGIALIGDFVSKLPSATQKGVVHELIEAGVRLGYISPDYQLIGHRQVSATECPGQALFEEITTWDHFGTSV